MRASNKRVVVAMSGGVDSSVTAALLLEQGYEVSGVSLRLWERERGERICSDHRGAARVAELLGIPHTLLDGRSLFFRDVVRPLAEDYRRGRTPNPCVACNRDFKLGVLLEWAKARGADYVATGHYARVARVGSSVALLRGRDAAKDQSYFLFALSREQLAAALFPLGELTKREVREKARQLALPVAERAESQDICLGDYRALVESLGGGSGLEGEIVDGEGRVLGRHGGVHRFTVGQRRGLGVAAREPLYVLRLEGERRRVVVGAREELRCRGLVARAVSWLEPPGAEEIEAEVQVRYRSPAVPCRVRLDGAGKAAVTFAAEPPVVAPGQAAVFYRGERVLGGGWIEAAL
jgi:tRNA-specific 2-thiouridylase